MMPAPARVLVCALLCVLTTPSTAFLPKKPNLVVFLQDDQDFVMGGWRPMKQTLQLIAAKGLFATNWFIHTPVCCPSRAELLSGRYFHNLRMPTNSGGCMHVQTGVAGLEDKPNEHSFAKYLVQERGYTAGWFGKHLNHCPSKPPPGYDCQTCRFFANGGGSDEEPGGYVNASFHDFEANTSVLNPQTSPSGMYKASTAGEFAGYTTSIIANKSIEWLHKVAGVTDATGATVPFVMTVASKSPHTAATVAKWYREGTWVDNESAPRTENWGVDPKLLAGHHALIAGQGPLLPNEERAIDMQFRKRWKSILCASPHPPPPAPLHASTAR